jgi:hypothetical protein
LSAAPVETGGIVMVMGTLRSKPLILRAGACLALGAATTLLVAWIAAALRPTDGWPNLWGRGPQEWSVKSQMPQFRYSTEFGDVLVSYFATAVSSEISVFPEWANPPEAISPLLAEYFPFPANVSAQELALYPGLRSFDLPGWAPRCGKGTTEHMIYHSAWGWPWRCAYGTERKYLRVLPDRSFQPRSEFDGYWVRAGHPSTLRVRRLPTTPIWPGLVQDTAFYAGGWSIALIAPSAVRLLWRRRRGLCPRCAYDLKHNLAAGCPECGWARPDATVD